jgi:tetratricopeptide (TPR) repeat protein
MQRAAGKWAAILLAAGSLSAWGQNASPASGNATGKASAYYYYTLGHMYAELAGIYGGRGEYVNQAIDNYKLAIKADPSAAEIAEELSDLYFQSGRLREAQTDAENTLKTNPNDLAAHRMLARIFVRQISDPQRNRIDQTMLRRTIEQFTKITELDAKDFDAWLMLGRLQKVSQNSAESEKAYKKALELKPDQEDALNGLALVYADLGDNKAATELLKKAAEKNPSANSLQTLASAYEQMREFTLAAEALRRALELSPANADEIKAKLAEDLIQGRKYDEALAIYEDMVAADPADAQSWLRISRLQLQRREIAKAREAADKAKGIEPNNVDIKYQEVFILDAEGKISEAIGSLKEILTATEKRSYSPGERQQRAGLLERLGGMQREADQTEAAVDTFRQMAALDPELGPRATVQVIESYRSGKMFAKAQQEADAAEKKWPNDRNVRIERASIQAEMGKADAAAADIKKLLDGKTDRETYITLAQLYDKGRKWDEMAKALDQAEKLAQDADDKQTVWFMRGAMFEKMKNIDAAEKEFKKVLADSPDNPGALNYLGYMLADRNVRLPEALGYINKALEGDPYNGAYLDTLGWVYFRMGRLAEAEDYLERALVRVPRDPTMRDHLAEVYYQRSKLKEAVTQWEAALKEWELSSPADLDKTEMNKVKAKLESAKTKLSQAR